MNSVSIANRKQATIFDTNVPTTNGVPLADGSYPLCNDFYAVIHPDAAADSPERRLYDWLDTADGIACIQKAGYVPAQSAAKAN